MIVKPEVASFLCKVRNSLECASMACIGWKIDVGLASFRYYRASSRYSTRTEVSSCFTLSCDAFIAILVLGATNVAYHINCMTRMRCF